MKVYKELYGCDADGNRGIYVYNYELESSDEEMVIEQLYPHFIDGEMGEKSIFILCPYTDEEIEIPVSIEEYQYQLLDKARNDTGLSVEDFYYLAEEVYKND